MKNPAPPAIPGLSPVRYLGSGGVADVFQYRDRTNAAYAVKVWRQQVGVEAMRALNLEAEALGRIAAFGTHPNIIAPSSSALLSNDLPYLVMELCPNGSLAGREPMPVGDVLRIGIQMCGALETSHQHNVLHCDVKPGNILLDRAGNAKLSDFGIAEAVNSREAPSDMRTLQYAAPEVEMYGEVSPLSDVYALAATLYELLSGHPPFRDVNGDNSSGAIDRRKRADVVPRLGRVDVPLELENLLRIALKSDLEERGSALRPSGGFGPAGVFGTALRNIAESGHYPQEKMIVFAPGDEIDEILEVATGRRISETPRPPVPEPVRVPAPSSTQDPTPARVAPTTDTNTLPGARTPAGPQQQQTPVIPPTQRRSELNKKNGSDKNESDKQADENEEIPGPRRSTARLVTLIASICVVLAAAVAVAISVGTGPDHEPPEPTASSSAILPVDPNVDTNVPTPKVVGKRLGDGSVMFTWTYTPVEPGDFYQVSRRDSTDSSQISVSDRYLRIPDAAGQRPCIQVVVVRTNGHPSTPGIGCAPNP